MPFFDHKDISLYYEIHGDGQPVLFLHGGGVNFHYNFEMCGWVNKFTNRGVKVIGLDFRGHGKSTKLYEPTAYGTHNLAEDVIALLDHLNIDCISLVGYSLGSAIALYLLSVYPSRFSKSSFIAAGDGLLGIPPYTSENITPEILNVLSKSEHSNDVPAQLSAFRSLIAATAGDREAIIKFMMGNYPSMGMKEVSSIQTPIFIISGEDDHVLGQAPKLAKSLPNSKYLKVTGAGHFDLAIDAEVQEKVINFLS